MASDFNKEDNKIDEELGANKQNVAPVDNVQDDDLDVIDISSDVEYLLNQERTGVEVIKLERNKSTRKLNSFDLFFIRVWAVIVAAITTISASISRGFFKLFKKELPERYVNAAIAFILIIILIIIVLAPFNLTVGEQNRVDIFSNSLVPVAKLQGNDLKWGYVNRSGREVIPFRFTNAEPFYNSVAFVQQDDTTWRLIGTNGKFKGNIRIMTDSVHPDRKMFGDFNNSEKRAWFIESGKYYFMKTNGSKAFGGEFFDYAESFSEGYALVKQGNDWFFINGNGKHKSPIYREAKSFTEGLAAVQKSSGWTFVNTKFKEVTVGNYDAVTQFHDGYAWVRIGNAINLVDKKGKTILPSEFSGMKPSDKDLRELGVEVYK